MKGFKQQPIPSRKEKLREIEAELQNTQMANRISQLMLKQLLQNSQTMQEDLGRALGLINELQYKVLAMQQCSNLDKDALNNAANTLRLSDFTEASTKENAEKGYTPGTVVDEDSVVVLTSTTDKPDHGIFRSKLKLVESGVPDLIKGLTGREVGAKVIITLNGMEHTVELLEIWQVPAQASVAEVTPITQA